MKSFNKIVLSETEPSTSDLWMRDTVQIIKDEDSNTTKKHLGKSLWWFAPEGWKKLFDFDTKCSITHDFDYDGADTPVDITSSYDEKGSSIDTELIFNMYDGSRELGDNKNIVTEEGLKFHIDTINTTLFGLRGSIAILRDEITSIDDKFTSQLDGIEQTIGEIVTSFSSLSENCSSQLELLRELNERVTALENKE